MSGLAHSVRRLQRRLLTAFAMRNALNAAAVWCFGWGIGVLVARAGWQAAWHDLAWGALGIAAAVALGVVLALRQLPEPMQLHAVVDRHSRAGGLVMAATETDTRAWIDRQAVFAHVPVRWRSCRTWGWFVTGLSFLVASLTIPMRPMGQGMSRSLHVANDVAILQQQLETMTEEQILEPDAAENWNEKLQRVQKEATLHESARTWEALDHLREQLADRSEQAAERSVAQLEQLTQVQNLATALAEAGHMLNAPALMESLAELADTAQQLDVDPAAIATLAKDGKLDRKSLRRLAKSAGICKSDIEKSVQHLVEARLIDASALKACRGACQSDQAALLAFLRSEGSQCSCQALLSICQPGRGGLTRGRGDAALTWKEPSNDEGVQFTPEALPPASLQAIKDATTIGVSVGAPDLADDDVTISGGALAGARAGGGSAHTATVLPRHRGAAQQYFQRE